MGGDGFTLLSLLAALAIIGIVFVIGAPRLAVLMAKARLEGAARNLATEIRRARFRAIAESVGDRVSFDAGARTFQVCRETAAGNGGRSRTPRHARSASIISRGSAAGAAARTAGRAASPAGPDATRCSRPAAACNS